MTPTTSEEIFERGTPVHKHTGDAPYYGVIVGSFRTMAGKLRYAVELESVPGMLHIESPRTIRRRT